MDRFVNEILTQVPGCTKYAIKQAVLQTAIRFCEDSLIWQLAGEETVSANESTLYLYTAPDSQIAHCHIFLNKELYKAYSRSGEVVTLYETVTADTNYNTISFLKPKEDATALPDILYHDWFDGISAGAKSRLQLQPGKQWTSLSLATINNELYQRNLNRARVLARETGVYAEFKAIRNTDF